MRRECCRCRVSLGPDIPDPLDWDRATRGEPVSHGFCEACLALEVRDAVMDAPARRAMRLAAETTDPGTDPGNW